MITGLIETPRPTSLSPPPSSALTPPPPHARAAACASRFCRTIARAPTARDYRNRWNARGRRLTRNADMYISFGCRKHAGQNNSAVKTPQSSPRDAEAGVHVQHADSPRPRREIPRAIKREVSIAASIIRLIKKPRAIEGRREREREREISCTSR